MPEPVHANRVRYIKLGEGGEWAEECLRSGTLRIGFWTDEYFDLCVEGKWDELARAFEARGRSKSTASNFVGQVRAVYEDNGTTLWVTFHTRRMYWTFVDARDTPWIAPHGEGSLRKTLPWRTETIRGAPLWMTSLPGRLTKTAGFPGASCDLERPDNVIRRINGEGAPEVTAAERLISQLQVAVIALLQLMDWKDFEVLVDLVFSTSGWRRQGDVGGEQTTTDIELELPSTGERALVQIKSATTQSELDAYRATFGGSTYDRMFFAYHTGNVQSADPRITLLGPDRLAKMIVEAGLVSWVLDKVR